MTQQPSLFRKKPVIVKAIQYPCAHPALRRCDCDSNSACSSCGLEYIETLEGCMNVSPGDWIITGVQGEHYPCKPDIFAATYEPATPPASAQDDAKDEKPYCYALETRGRWGDEHDVLLDVEYNATDSFSGGRTGGIPLYRRPAPAAGDALAALRELVACDNLKKQIASMQVCVMETDDDVQELDAMMSDLARRQPAAWDAARAALAAQVPQQGEA